MAVSFDSNQSFSYQNNINEGVPALSKEEASATEIIVSHNDTEITTRPQKPRKKRAMLRSLASQRGIMVPTSLNMIESPKQKQAVTSTPSDPELERLRITYEEASAAASDWWSHGVQSENPNGPNYFPSNPEGLGLKRNDWAGWQTQRDAFQQQWNDKGSELQKEANAAYTAYVSYTPGENPIQKSKDQIQAEYGQLTTQFNAMESNYKALETRYLKLKDDFTKLPPAQQASLQSEMNSLKLQMEGIKAQIKQVETEFSEATSLYNSSKNEEDLEVLQQTLNTLKSGPLSKHLNTLNTQIQGASKTITEINNKIKPGAEIPPGTQIDPNKILQVDGVSLYEWNGLYFPVGLVLPLGQPGDSHNYSPSEAWGYAIRNAVEANDPELFQKLATSYLYFSNQTEIARANAGMAAGWGLMGWSPDIINGTFPSDPQFFSAASDADEDIINGLIAGHTKFGNMEFTDPVTSSGSNVKKTITLENMILEAAKSFVAKDLGTATISGYTAYMLTDNNWGHDAVHPDYFDPQMFVNLIKFLDAHNSNGEYNSEIKNLTLAAQNTMKAIVIISEKNNGWIPNSPYDSPATADTFGYEAVRILMRLAEYSATPGEDILGIKNDATIALKNLVANIIPLCVQNNGTYQFPPSGLNRGQFTGPLLLALKALESQNALPSNVTAETIKIVEECFKRDLQDYNISSRQAWQDTSYFAMQLIILSQGIMIDKELLT